MTSQDWSIIGHEWAIAYLQRSIASGRGAHAYLLSGPAGIGKTLLALRMAQVLNCERGGDAPCLQCRTCRRIERGNHPDVRIASMESQAAALPAAEAARQKDLKIGTIRTWQSDITLKPYEGRRRVFILHDAERLNEEASNAMLKTLEEPPPFATIILVAHNANMLPTIISRCQVLRLRPLPRQQITRALSEQTSFHPDDAALLAAWSGGRIGWALRMARAPDDIQAYQERIDHLLTIQTQPRNATFAWAEERSKEYRGGEQDVVFGWLDLWQGVWRDVLLVAAGCPERITHIDRQKDLETLAHRHSVRDIYRFVSRIGKTAQQLRENVNPQLALENLFLHLPV